jgi:hypothetical protein
MKEIKHRIIIDISVDSSDEEEDSPYPEISDAEQVLPKIKRFKIDSPGPEKYGEPEFEYQNKVGEDMNLAKQITVQEFGFISKVSPYGFHTVQTGEDEKGDVVYREHEFTIYYTEEDYPKYTRFVLSTFLFVTLLGHEKKHFESNQISFKLAATVNGLDLSNYWLSIGNQNHPRRNNWLYAENWTKEYLIEKATFFKAPLTQFKIFDDEGNCLGVPFKDKAYLV